MSLNNIKAKQAQRGFTIVELLIVIVVIGILAAITLVSYNGITTRANAASAKAASATFQKKAELYQADGTTGKYPLLIADLTGAAATASYAMTAGNPTVTPVTTAVSLTAAVTSANGTDTIAFRKCSSGVVATQSLVTSSNIVGLEIYHFDYDTGSGHITTDVGDTTNCVVDP
jgi:prepilin-type N-terminal cleavage/methylation domain-containing protein